MRVLKPGGLFLAVDLGASGHSLMGHVSAFMKKHPTDLSTEVPALKNAGFEDVETGTMPFRLLGYARGRKPGTGTAG
jgi:hypothetical protein